MTLGESADVATMDDHVTKAERSSATTPDALLLTISALVDDSDWADWLTEVVEEQGHKTVASALPSSVSVASLADLVASSDGDLTFLVGTDELCQALEDESVAGGLPAELLVFWIEDLPIPRALSGATHVVLNADDNDYDSTSELVISSMTTVHKRKLAAPRTPASVAATGAAAAAGAANADAADGSGSPDSKTPLSKETSPTVWQVPFDRNPHFAGRDSVLAHLGGELNRGDEVDDQGPPLSAETPATPLARPTTQPLAVDLRDSSAGLAVQALVGTNGVGKSAIAAEHAYRHRDVLSVAWWVRARTRSTLVADLELLAHALELDASLPPLVALREWMETTEDPWLIVLDDLEGWEDVADFLPDRAAGQVLITSRRRDLQPLGQIHDVSGFDPDTATAFLVDRCDSNDRVGAAKVANQLGGLPVVLELAGCYVARTGVDFAEYLDILDDAEPPEIIPDAEPETVTEATVATTLASVESAAPNSAALAIAFSSLAPEPIPRKLLDRLDANDEIVYVRVLQAMSIVAGTDDSISMNPQIGEALRRMRAPESAVQSTTFLLELLDREIADDDSVGLSALMPHILAVLDDAEQRELSAPSRSRLTAHAAGWLAETGDVRAAKPLADEALERCRADFGDDHALTRKSKRTLADLHVELGNVEEALRLQREVVADNERELGSGDIETVRSRASLAANLALAGETIESEDESAKVAPFAADLFGTGHPETLAIHERADRAAARSEKTSPTTPSETRPVQAPDVVAEQDVAPSDSVPATPPVPRPAPSAPPIPGSPSPRPVTGVPTPVAKATPPTPPAPVVTSSAPQAPPAPKPVAASPTPAPAPSPLSDDGRREIDLDQLGTPSEAATPAAKTVDTTEGPSETTSRSETAVAAAGAAVVAAGAATKVSKAETPKKTVPAPVDPVEKVDSPETPAIVDDTKAVPSGDTAKPAVEAQATEDSTEATDASPKAQHDKKPVPEAAATADDEPQPAGDDVDSLQAEADRLRETQGPDAPEYLGAVGRYAGAVADGGNYSKALAIQEELVASHEKVHGPMHAQTLTARNNLANTVAATGDHQRALELQREVAQQYEETVGPDHPTSLTAMHNLANSYADTGDHARALQLRLLVLDKRQVILGPDHPQTLGARNNLANSYADTGDHDKARELREAVLADREAVLGADHPQTLGARNNLANSYADTGNHEKALELRKRVLDDRQRILGGDHPHTLTARNNLANSFAALDRHKEACGLRETALDDCERILGPDHPHTVTARNNLANSYAELGERAKAAELRARVLADRERQLGIRETSGEGPVAPSAPNAGLGGKMKGWLRRG